jgi:hypothetical protein
MAGFIVFIGGSSEAEALLRLETILNRGAYATMLKPTEKRWRDSHEGTFADYSTMVAGDSIFFFAKRNLYGVGQLVDVGFDCKFANFAGASWPVAADYDAVQSDLLIDDGPDHLWERWLCTFKPDPYFFRRGVDMDDALSSNPEAFRSLRAMDNVTFARVDDVEEQALRSAIIRANEDSLSAPPTTRVFSDAHKAVHADIRRRLKSHHMLSPTPLLRSCAIGDRLGHEKALEAGVAAQLASREPGTVSAFGSWDYISHQVLASPFKPLVWADKMDVFGYRYIPGHEPTVSKYLVIEMKRDASTIENVDQAMKYVDWIKDEYAGGDYSSIEAYLLAYDHPQTVRERAAEAGRRVFTIGRRPARLLEWDSLRLVSYSFNETSGLLEFS